MEFKIVGDGKQTTFEFNGPRPLVQVYDDEDNGRSTEPDVFASPVHIKVEFDPVRPPAVGKDYTVTVL